MLNHATLLALKKDFSEKLLQYEPGCAFEQHKWDFTNHSGKVAVQVLRGKLFEKACVSEITATVTLPNRSNETSIEWLGVQIFPSNPLVPMLCAVFEQIREQGELRCPCFFDVYPVVSYQEDRLDLHKLLAAVCKKFGRPYPDLPESYLKMYQVQEPGMGVGYGIGLALSGQEKAQDFYTEASRALFSGYFQIIDRRKDSVSTQHQVADMDAYRSDMVKFVFMENRFFKGGVQLGIPAESFMLHMLPPTARF
jgi:coproporphyrinogen III oxidase